MILDRGLLEVRSHSGVSQSIIVADRDPTVCCLISLSGATLAELIWWDGTRSPGDTAPGKLLSDNEDYWAEVVLTGITYQYETAPDRPSDNRKDRLGYL